MNFKKTAALFFGCVMIFGNGLASAQTRELIPFGDFQNWLKRDIKESALLGGNTKRVFAIAPNNTIAGPVPYRRGVSPWSTSNVYAKVMGIVKTSNTVFPGDKSGGDMCAKLESSMVTCKVLGMVNITIMVAGTIFLGETIEPVQNADNPYEKLDMGIPFTKKPKALIFDYSAKLATHNTITTAKGWSVKTDSGKDKMQVFVLLQNRRQNADGSITAQRVGTGKMYITNSTNGWVNEHKLPIHYGNITAEPFYKSYMGLTSMYYAKNKSGDMVKVIESGWATEAVPVTHAVVFFSSSSFEAFRGAVGNVFCVDNVKFEY